MRLLVVTPLFPQRRSGGFGLRTLGILRELSRAHEIHLVCLCSAQSHCEPDADDLTEVRELVMDLDLHLLGRARAPRLDEWLRRRAGVVPRQAQIFQGETPHQLMRGALAKKPALVFFESIFPAVLAELVPRECPIVLDEHNVEYLLERRAIRPGDFHPLRLMSQRIRWRRLRRFEARRMAAADLVFATSEVDRNYLLQLQHEVPIEVIPNGVVIRADAPPPEAEKPGRILLTGLMDYPPNIDAARWFARQVFPRLRQHCPEVELVISGNRPTAAVQALGDDPLITVTGHVPDMLREIDRAAIVVVPLRQGSGTRVKILEAWSRRKAVVSTSLGSEGLSFSPGRDIVLANRPADFLARIQELLANPDLRRRIGQRGFETARDRYSWANIGRILREHLDHLLQSWPDGTS